MARTREFASWSIGGAAIQDASTPPTNATFTATFRLTCPPDVISQFWTRTIRVTCRDDGVLPAVGGDPEQDRRQ